MTISAIQCRLETWVDQAKPKQGHGNDARIRLNAAGGSQRYAYIFFGLPFPFNAGIIINSATLSLFVAGSGWSGSNTLNVNRVTETWSEEGPNKMTWDNFAGAGGVDYSASVSSASDGDQVDVDVTALISNMADGTFDWHGLFLYVSTSGNKAFYSSNSEDPDHFPLLTIDWDLPTGYTVDMTPSSMRAVDVPAPMLSWRADYKGKHKVIVAKSSVLDEEGKLTDAIYQSRWGDDAQHDLSNKKSFPGMKEGDTLYWQVALQNRNGTSGPWSPVAAFTYHKPTKVTISSPKATTNDSTPLIAHSVKGHEQIAVEFLIKKNGHMLHSSGKAKSSATQYEVPPGVMGDDGEYEAVVRVWDDVIRVRNKATEASKTFNYKNATAGNPVSDLVELPQGKSRPGIHLAWKHDGDADAFDIKIDGRAVKRIHAEDAQEAEGYAHSMRMNMPKDAVITVEAVTGRQNSAPQPLTITNAVLNKWLSSPTIDVILFGEDPVFKIGADEEVYFPPGRRDPIKVRQTARGYEGSFAGSIGPYPPASVTSDQQRDKLLAILALPISTVIRFAWRNIDIPILLLDMNGPMTHTRADWYDVGFQFIQTGDFTYTP